jgi:hypothetical protein
MVASSGECQNNGQSDLNAVVPRMRLAARKEGKARRGEGEGESDLNAIVPQMRPPARRRKPSARLYRR